jgi:hypothetical protein
MQKKYGKGSSIVGAVLVVGFYAATIIFTSPVARAKSEQDRIDLSNKSAQEQAGVFGNITSTTKTADQTAPRTARTGAYAGARDEAPPYYMDPAYMATHCLRQKVPGDEIYCTAERQQHPESPYYRDNTTPTTPINTSIPTAPCSTAMTGTGVPAPSTPGDTSLDNQSSIQLIFGLLRTGFGFAHIPTPGDPCSFAATDKFIAESAVKAKALQDYISQLAISMSGGSGGNGSGNVAQYQTMVDQATADNNAAKALLDQNSVTESAALAQKASTEMSSAQTAIQSDLLSQNINVPTLSNDYKNTVTTAADGLTTVAGITKSNGNSAVGTSLNNVAQAQAVSADKVGTLVNNAQSRSKFTEFMIGPSYADLKGIQQQIASNQANIQSLSQASTQLSDPNLKQVVQTQSTALNNENTKLQSFVAGKESQKGVFGWFYRALGK